MDAEPAWCIVVYRGQSFEMTGRLATGTSNEGNPSVVQKLSHIETFIGLFSP